MNKTYLWVIMLALGVSPAFAGDGTNMAEFTGVLMNSEGPDKLMETPPSDNNVTETENSMNPVVPEDVVALEQTDELDGGDNA